MSSESTDTGANLIGLAQELEQAQTVTPSTESLIQAIRLADELGKKSQAILQTSVSAARTHGISWQAIGDTLGTSRQAAFKKFTAPSAVAIEDDTTGIAIADLAARTEQIFINLAAGDFESVKKLMTFTCSRALTKRKVMAVWDQVESSSGRLEHCSDTIAQTLDGRNTMEKFLNRHLAGGLAIQTQLHHEVGEWTGRVAYNGAGKITGILIAPPHSEDLAF